MSINITYMHAYEHIYTTHVKVYTDKSRLSIVDQNSRLQATLGIMGNEEVFCFAAINRSYG